jgi:hypothetical protein
MCGDVGLELATSKIRCKHGIQLEGKDFDLILVLATRRLAIGGRIGWESSAEEISAGIWEARMHHIEQRC